MNEHGKNIVVAVTSAIPLVGGPISVLVDKYVPIELEKRRNNLINKIDKDIEKIREQIKPGRLESEEYMTILFKVFKSAIEEHQEEKLKSFRGILQNSAISEDIKDPEIEYFIRLVNELTTTHIFILNHIEGDTFWENVTYTTTGVIEIELQSLCLNDLKRLGLIFNVRGSIYKDRKHNESKYSISELGKRFYRFIQLK